MKHLTATVAFALLAAATMTAKADIVDDPLHIACTGCIDNGTNTPLPAGTSTFGFTSSPPGAAGVLVLEVLVPNNTNLGTFVIPNITGFASGTPNLFSVTAWTAGTLTNYLGGSFAGGAPDNPIGAYLPSTQSVDIGATGFFTFLFTAGQVTLGGQSDPLADSFTLNGGSNLPDGSYILAAMITPDGVINTANSAAGFVHAVPGPVVGAGLPGLLAVGLFCVNWLRRRRREIFSSVRQLA